MTRIDVISGVPELLNSPLKESILKRAQEKKLVEIVIHNLRDYTHDKHRTIDDTMYGGGAGMVLKPEPFFECVEKLKSERTYDEIICLTADGEFFTQKVAIELSLRQNLMFLCGHYKGIDQRVIDALTTRELSIGPYVLTGGELAAAVIIDAVIRLIPGVLNDSESALTDSYGDEPGSYPVYTRPPVHKGYSVPEVLLSGNHEKISQWRTEQRLQRTKELKERLKLLGL